MSEIRNPAIEDVPTTLAEALALVERYRTESIELKIMLDATEQYSSILARADQGERGVQAELDSVRSQLSAERSVAENLRAQLARLEVATDQLRSQLERGRGEIGDVRTQLNAANGAADEARHQLSAAMRAADQARAQLAEAAGQLSAANSQCQTLDSELATLRSERDTLQDRLASEMEISPIDAQQLADLQAANEELEEQLAVLRSERDEAAANGADQAAIAAAADQLESDLAAQQATSEELRGLLADRDRYVEQLRGQIQTTAQGQPVEDQSIAYRLTADQPFDNARIAELEEALNNEIQLRADLQTELDSIRDSERTAVSELKAVQQDLFLLQTRSSMMANRVAQAEQERDKLARAKESDTTKRGFFSRLRRSDADESS